MIIIATSAYTAKMLGFNNFFSLKPCKRGHIGWRNRVTYSCKECCKIYRDTSVERGTRYPKNPKPKSPEQKEKERLRAFGWKERNPHRVKMQSARYYKENRQHLIHLGAQSKRKVRRATPKWLTKFQKQQIALIYTVRDELTKLNGVQYHVDHKVPINGKIVCGLHVPWNLQVMEGAENINKSNKFDENNGLELLNGN